MNNLDQEDDAWSYVSEPGAIPGAFAPPDMAEPVAPEPAPTQPSLPPALPAPRAAPQAAPPPSPVPLPANFDVQAARGVQQAVRTRVPLRDHYTPSSNPDFVQRGNMLGFATVAAGIGAIAGLRLGGVYGGVAGTLFAGAATNAYRAFMHHRTGTQDGRREAMVSGTWAIVSAGLGGYLLYMTKGKKGKEMTPNPSDDSSDERCATKNGRRSCNIRAIV